MQLAKRKSDLQTQQTAFRAQRSKRPMLGHHFMREAERVLPRELYDAIEAVARRNAGAEIAERTMRIEDRIEIANATGPLASLAQVWPQTT